MKAWLVSAVVGVAMMSLSLRVLEGVVRWRTEPETEHPETPEIVLWDADEEAPSLLSDLRAGPATGGVDLPQSFSWDEPDGVELGPASTLSDFRVRGPIAADQADEPPQRQGCDAQGFPSKARFTGHREGVVDLLVNLSSRGEIERVRVLQANPPVFEEAARAYMATCSFSPARHQGRPVAVLMRHRVRFEEGQ